MTVCDIFFFFKQKTAYEILALTGVQTCALPISIRQGRSVDTTMGFTPIEGLMMGTRSGSVDPGILVHLLRQGYDAEHLRSEERRVGKECRSRWSPYH